MAAPPPPSDVQEPDLKDLLDQTRARLAERISGELAEYSKHVPHTQDAQFRCCEAYEAHVRDTAVGELRDIVTAERRRRVGGPAVVHVPAHAASLWKVVGGQETGGLIVRAERSFQAAPAGERLSSGACVEQLELAGDRLRYRLVSGTGPETGWVSVRVKDRPTAVRLLPGEAADSLEQIFTGEELLGRLAEAQRRGAHGAEWRRRAEQLRRVRADEDAARDAEAKGLQTCGGCLARRVKKDPGKDAVWHCSACRKAHRPADGPGPAAGKKAETLSEQKALVAGRRAAADAALNRLRLKCATPGCALCVRSTEGEEARFCCSMCKAGSAHASCCEGVPWVQPVVIIGLLAASITTEARLTHFRHILRSVLGQELRRGEAEFTVGLSWSSTPALKTKVQGAIDELVALAPSSSLVAQRQSEPRSHFQHLRAALELVEERWRSDGSGPESQESVWVLFGNDRDLWQHSRVREYGCAVRAHPLLEGVAAVATMARARSLAVDVEHEKLPSTERAVDDDLVRGRAALSDEGKSARAWRKDLDHSGGDAVRLPENADFELRFFDFCPRLRLLHEFFEATAANVLGHPFCDARLGHFLATYPQRGREMGLAVHFFKPLSSCWIYFHAHEGVGHRRRLWQQQHHGASEGKAAATAAAERASSGAVATTDEAGVEATERKLAADLLPKCRLFDKSLTESRLSQFLTTFRTSVELWLIRYHRCRMGQVPFDEQVVKLTRHAFASARGAAGPKTLSPHMYKICRDVARAEAAYFRVEVDWRSEQDLLTPNIPPDYCEERGKTVFKEPPRKVLEKWSGNFKVHKIMRGFVPEARRGEADVIAFQDAHLLLDRVGIGLSDLESVFGGGGAAQDGGAGAGTPAGEPVAPESILRRFVTKQLDVQGELHFTDVYRMLVAAGLDLSTFLSRLGGDSGGGPGGGDEAAAAAREAQGNGDDDDDDGGGGGVGPRIGNYRVIRELGRGMGCSTVYLAEHVTAGTAAAAGTGAVGQSPAAAQVALKWPVEAEEVDVMREVHRQQAEGLPGLLAAGVHEGEHWFASEILGADLETIFQCLSEHPLEERWKAVQVIGRMVLRRLEVLHRSGYVHGDVATQNVLMGRAGGGGGGGRETAYLIDFGCARRFPGSGPVPAEKVGSMEFSSVASAEGRARRPEDDLEALGWVLVHGVFGGLPWFEWLAGWYTQPGQTSFRFERIVRRVQRAKSQLLDEGWGSLGPNYAGLAGLPVELVSFIRECRAPVEPSGLPDYTRLARLLGGVAHFSPEEAEASDRRQYQDKVATLLDKAHPLLGLMLKAAQVDVAKGFSKGDSVQVWSMSRNTWVDDGVVDEVAHQDLVAHGRQLPGVATLFAAANIDLEGFVVPQGSLHVLYGGGAGEKWILPWEQKELLRRAPGASAARPAMTAVAA